VKLKEQQLFFLPGLYSVVELPDTGTGEVIKRWTYTIITRAANKVMEQIHNGGENAGRMPLFLPFEMAQEWLFDLTEERYREILNYRNAG
jgi:putative SOS response-associated peptidase YedK